MSDSESEEPTGEHATSRTKQLRECQRCERKQGLVGKYNIYLCRQCYREVSRSMGFKKYS